MFLTTKYILYISADTISVATVAGAAKKKSTVRKKLPWSKETLAKVLLSIKKDFKGAYSAVLGDEFTFVFAVTIPADVTNEREFVRIKVSEEVPQEIGEEGWDFKELLKNPDKKEKIVQCAVVDRNFYDDFSDAVRKSGIVIDTMEPMVYAFSRMFEEHPEPSLVVYQEESIVAWVTYRGLVFSSMRLDAGSDPAALVQFLEFIKNKFSIAPRNIFVAGPPALHDRMHTLFPGSAMERGVLDPFVAMAQKKDRAGKDETSLNILPAIKQPSAESKLQQKIVGVSGLSPDSGVISQYERIAEEHDLYPQGKLFTALIIISSFLIISANGFLWYERLQEERIMHASVPAIVPRAIVVPMTATSTATTSTTTGVSGAAQPQEATMAAYRIRIENGGGVPGGAKKMKQLLDAQGFRVTQVGNADNFNYRQTTVRYAATVTDSFRNAVEKILSAQYTVVQGAILSSDATVDMVIIIGK